MGRGRARARQTLNYRSAKFRREGDDDGGAREPRQPLPSPISGAGAKPLPKPIIEARPGQTDV